MRIGELSEITGVSIPTIRLYEREGLIDPASRTVGRFREFTPDQERRLDFIKRVRNLGFSLDEVKAFLALSREADEASCSELWDRIDAAVAGRERDLNRLMDCLRDARTGVIPFADLDSAFRR